MAEIIDTLPGDDRFCVWVCLKHGIIDEGDLAEGVDWAAGMQMNGDVAWTDRFYCQSDDHEDDDDREARLVDVGPDVRAVLPAAFREQRLAPETDQAKET